MPHFTLDEAISEIKKKTGKQLSNRELAYAYSQGELQVCFILFVGGDTCLTVLDDRSVSDTPYGEVLTGIQRESVREDIHSKPSLVHLRPSFAHHVSDVARLITNHQDAEKLEVQYVSNLNALTIDLMLINKVDFSKLYGLTTKINIKKGVNEEVSYLCFNEKMTFSELKNKVGNRASLDFSIGFNELLIEEESLKLYINSKKPKKAPDTYSHGSTMRLAKRIANKLIGIDAEKILSKGMVGERIYEKLKATPHSVNIGGHHIGPIKSWIVDCWPKGAKAPNGTTKKIKEDSKKLLDDNDHTIDKLINDFK